MGGPAVSVYLPAALSDQDIDAVERIMKDKTWRACVANVDVLHVFVQDMSSEHGPDQIDALEISLGWRPAQQIQVVSYANSRIEYHIDLAVAAARFARMFRGRIGVLVDPGCYEQMASPSFEILDAVQHHRYMIGRIVDPEWLDEFLTREEPRFWK